MNNIKILKATSKNLLNISPEFASENNLLLVRDTILKFGFKSLEVKLEVDPSLSKKQIAISEDILRKLNLPKTQRYQVVSQNNEIILGPFIGIFLGADQETLYKRVQVLNNYVKLYEEINGVIVGFTLDGVKRENLTIDGLVYNPIYKVWERHTVPYPSAIIKRGFLNQSNRQYFYSLYGEKIYNYKPINKWEMHRKLYQFDEIRQHLPESSLYIDAQSMLNFLEEHKDIYVKPIGGNQGKGIYNIVKEEDVIRVKTRRKGENISIICQDQEAVNEFVKKHLESQKFIMQKTLRLSVNNRVLDFRVGMDKNIEGVWKHNMFVTRVGGDQSIVSNVATSGGYVEHPINALRNIYKLKESEAKNVENQLLDIAYKVANSLDLTGIRLGKIALDLCLDDKHNIYLIEVNNRLPNDNLMKPLGDREKIHKIRLENMKYAKRLSGFLQNNNYTFTLSDENELKEVRNRLLIRTSLKRQELLKEVLLEYASHYSLDVNIESGQDHLIISPIKSNKTLYALINLINKNTKNAPNLFIVERMPVIKKRPKRKTKAIQSAESRKIIELTKELEAIKASNSWKITAPLRKLSKILKL